MASWDLIATGDDHSATFGSQQFIEDNGSIFETCLLLLIKANGNVAEQPNVLSKICSNYLHLAIDNVMIIFASGQYTTPVFYAAFDAKIECYCVLDDFIVVCLRDGNIQGQSISKGNLIFRLYIEELSGSSGQCFCDIKFVDGTFLVFCYSAHIYRLSCPELMETLESLSNFDETISESLEIRCHCEEITRQRHFKKPLNTVISHDQNHLIIAGKELCVWNFRTYHETVSEIAAVLSPLKNVYNFRNNTFSIGLTSDGFLVVVCQITLQISMMWSQEVLRDFRVLEGATPDEEMSLILLTASETNTRILIISYPNMKILYQLPVAGTTFLVNSLISSGDLLFVEGKLNNDQNIDAFGIYSIAKSLPEFKLTQLLKRHFFSEAEQFAIKYKLNVQDVYKSQALMVVSKLNTTVKSCLETEELISTLIDILTRCQDVIFVVECCMNVVQTDFKNMKKLLDFAQDELDRAILRDKTNQVLWNIQSNLFEVCLRHETYKMIIMQSGENVIEGGWAMFSKTDIVQIIEMFLKHEQFELLIFMWSRFQHLILGNGAAGHCERLLAMTPTTARPDAILLWFRHFIPSLIIHYSDGLSLVVQFVIDKIISLENLSDPSWPEIAINFSEEILSLFRTDDTAATSNAVLSFQQIYLVKNSPWQRLTELLRYLKELMILKNEHNLFVPLHLFTNNDYKALFICILNNIQPENINHLFDKFLDDFMLKNDIASDEMLVEYVDDITSDCHASLLFTEAPWEVRVVPLIKRIHGIQERLMATIRVVKEAPVPLTQRIENLVQEGLECEHPLVNQLQAEKRNVQLRIVMKKYNYKIKATEEICMQLLRKIVSSGHLKEILLDAEAVLKCFALRNFFEKMLVTNLIKNQRFIELNSFIDTLEPMDVLKCCKNIVEMLERSLELKPCVSSYEIAGNICQIILIVKERIGTASKILSRDSGGLEKKIDDLKNIYMLREEFSLEIKPSAYCLEQVRSEECETCISHLIEEFEASVSGLSKSELDIFVGHTVKKAYQIARLFLFPKEEGILRLVRRISSQRIKISLSNCLLSSGVNICTNAEQAKCYAKIAVQLLFGANTINPEPLSDTDDENLMQMMSKVSVQLADSACVFIAGDQFDLSYVEIARWASLLHQVAANGITLDNADYGGDQLRCWRFTHWYRDAPLVGMQSVTYQNVLNFFEQILHLATIHSGEPLLEVLSDSVTGKVDTLFMNLTVSLSNLQRSRNYFTALKVANAVTFFLYFLPDVLKLSVEKRSLVVLAEQMVKTSIKTLLLNIITRRKLDLELAVNLLGTFGKAHAHRWIASALNAYRSDISKLSLICQVSTAYLSKDILPNELRQLPEIAKRCKWVQKLNNLHPQSREIMNINVESMIQFVGETANHISIDVIIELSIDFGLNPQETLLNRLSIVLLKWKPEIEDSGHELIVKNTDKDLVQRCEEIIERIENKDSLQKLLRNIWEEVNFYCYEVYLCILKHFPNIHPHSAIDQKLLLFLLQYKRISVAAQSEREKWNGTFPDSVEFPDIAKWRLPFTVFRQDPMIAIKPELNIFTCDKWITAVKCLNLNEDLLYMYAVKQTVNSELWLKQFAIQENTEWCLYSKNVDVLKRIEAFARQIKEVDVSLGVLYYVTNNTPPGLDRVIAARLCYQLCNEWAAQRKEMCVEKINKQYLTVSCLHILHSRGLGAMGHLLARPRNLLTALYNHPSVVERARTAGLYYPDVNKAAEEVAKLLGIDIHAFRIELVQELLQANKIEAVDDTFMVTDVMLNNTTNLADLTNNNLLKTCYILQAEPQNEAIAYLLSIAMEADQENMNDTLLGMSPNDSLNRGNVSLATRQGALNCLLCLADPETIEAITSIPFETIKNYSRTLWYLIQLRILGVEYNSQNFDSHDKLLLVQWLLSVHGRHPPTTPLCAALMLQYNIRQPDLWESVLKKMITFQMIGELKQLLPRLISILPLLTDVAHIRAWELVLEEPFSCARIPLIESDEQNCIASLNLSLTCPVIRCLNLKTIMDHCLRIEKPAFAATLLPYFSEEKQKMYVEKILGITTLSVVLNNIRQLSQFGIITTKQSILILRKFERSATA